jgi:hypothetical protein
VPLKSYGIYEVLCISKVDVFEPISLPLVVDLDWLRYLFVDDMIRMEVVLVDDFASVELTKASRSRSVGAGLHGNVLNRHLLHVIGSQGDGLGTEELRRPLPHLPCNIGVMIIWMRFGSRMRRYSK